MNETPPFRSSQQPALNDPPSTRQLASPREAVQPNLSAHPEDNDEIDLLQLLSTVWRGKFWIAATMLLAVLIGGYYAYVQAVPIYTASSIVVLEDQKSSVVDIEAVVSGVGTDQSALNTELEILRSRNLIGKLVKKLKLDEDPEFNALLRPDEGNAIKKLISYLKGFVESVIGKPAETGEAVTEDRTADNVINNVLNSVSVSNPRSTFIFEITAETQSARKSALIANTLADLYIQDQLQVKFDKTRQATQWLSDRVAELQTEVEQSAEAVKQFRTTADIVSREALEALNLQMIASRDRLSTNQAAQRDLVARLEALRTVRETGDPTQMAETGNDRFLTRLLDSTDIGDAATRSAFDDRFDQVIAGVEADLQRERSQEALLRTALDNRAAEIESQSRELVRLQQLERESEANRLIYEYFLTRLKETSVQEGIQQADSRVLSPAVTPNVPSAPRKSMILALSAMLGLMAGAAAVLLREMRHSGFRTGEDLERLTGYTVMGQIPKIPGRNRTAIINYLMQKPTSAAAEAIRNLRTSLLLSNVDRPPQVIMMTSSLPGEGKTTLSISLAHNLAGMGRRVLLVEGDIRRRTFGMYFKIDKKEGLLSVVSGETTLAETVFKNKELGIDILMGERSSTNAADVFSSQRFRAFIDDMRHEYDTIIIDTPPVLVVPDARVLGQHADAIVYNVHWDKTSRVQVQEGLRQFRTVGLHVSGLVLDQIDPVKMKRYGYGGKYGSYSAYYAKGYYDS